MSIVDTPKAGDMITKEGIPTEQFHTLLQALEIAVNLNTPLTGTGSPEGVIAANPYQVYLDTAGSTGTIEYRKMTGTGNTGWVLI
jgi:hypothetical protein